METRILLLIFSLSNGNQVYKFHAFIPTQDKTGYTEYVKKVKRVPRKRLSPKVIIKTFVSSSIIDKERLDFRISYFYGLPRIEAIIKR